MEIPVIAAFFLGGATAVASVFGSVPIKVGNIPAAEHFSVEYKCGVGCPFANLRQEVRTLQVERKVKVINSAVNKRIRYLTDEKLYGETDYWASPTETSRNRAGDCEDIATLKMALLKEAGVGENQMVVTVLLNQLTKQHHAVLVLTLGNRKLVLDNLSDAIFLDSELEHYMPLYSVNETGTWLHGRAIAKPDKAPFSPTT